VEIETTLGRFNVELNVEQAPIATANFLRYVEDGYYEGTAVHQVVPGVMIGAGAYTTQLMPKTDGLRDPIPSEWSEDMKNTRGSIGMYRKPGELDSAQSEFYINLQENPRLDEPRDGAGYVAFGRVIEGMDVIDRIGATQLKAHPGNPNGPLSVPIVPIMMVSTKILGEFDLASLEAETQEQLKGRASEAEAFQKGQEGEVQNIIDQTKEEFGVDFTTTGSGLMHATLREGDGPTPPSSSSNVKVHYEGTLTNGKKFDSSYDRNAPATFPLNRVIPGWTEGVGSMKVGEKRRLIIPSDLGYGDRGAPPDIPGKATLVFDVELLAIE
jgi:FKBP-type peptidyl-prolyl cis-trans isomerase